jgi:hypothetical protein
MSGSIPRVPGETPYTLTNIPEPDLTIRKEIPEPWYKLSFLKSSPIESPPVDMLLMKITVNSVLLDIFVKLGLEEANKIIGNYVMKYWDYYTRNINKYSINQIYRYLNTPCFQQLLESHKLQLSLNAPFQENQEVKNIFFKSALMTIVPKCIDGFDEHDTTDYEFDPTTRNPIFAKKNRGYTTLGRPPCNIKIRQSTLNMDNFLEKIKENPQGRKIDDIIFYDELPNTLEKSEMKLLYTMLTEIHKIIGDILPEQQSLHGGGGSSVPRDSSSKSFLEQINDFFYRQWLLKTNTKTIKEIGKEISSPCFQQYIANLKTGILSSKILTTANLDISPLQFLFTKMQNIVLLYIEGFKSLGSIEEDATGTLYATDLRTLAVLRNSPCSIKMKRSVYETLKASLSEQDQAKYNTSINNAQGGYRRRKTKKHKRKFYKRTRNI